MGCVLGIRGLDPVGSGQFAWKRGEHNTTVFGECQIIFYAYSTDAGDVDARLDREHHTRLKRLCGALHDVRLFMDLQT